MNEGDPTVTVIRLRMYGGRPVGCHWGFMFFHQTCLSKVFLSRNQANPIRALSHFWKGILFGIAFGQVFLSRNQANPIRALTHFWKGILFGIALGQVVLSRNQANPIRALTRFWKGRLVVKPCFYVVFFWEVRMSPGFDHSFTIVFLADRPHPGIYPNVKTAMKNENKMVATKMVSKWKTHFIFQLRC